jgi:hypothetical protein
VDDSYAEMQMIESILKAADYSVVALPAADHIEISLLRTNRMS